MERAQVTGPGSLPRSAGRRREWRQGDVDLAEVGVAGVPAESGFAAVKNPTPWRSKISVPPAAGLPSRSRSVSMNGRGEQRLHGGQDRRGDSAMVRRAVRSSSGLSRTHRARRCFLRPTVRPMARSVRTSVRAASTKSSPMPASSAAARTWVRAYPSVRPSPEPGSVPSAFDDARPRPGGPLGLELRGALPEPAGFGFGRNRLVGQLGPACGRPQELLGGSPGRPSWRIGPGPPPRAYGCVISSETAAAGDGGGDVPHVCGYRRRGPLLLG